VARHKSKKILLTNEQLKLLAGFFSDLAKGVAIASIVGQGFVLEFAGLTRIVSLVVWIFTACLFLFFGLYFSKEIK